MVQIYRRRGAVIFTDGSHRAWQVQCCQIIRARFRMKEGFILGFARCVQVKPIFDIAQDHAFWAIMRLRQPEPVIIAKAEGHIGAFEVLKRRDDIQYAKPFHRSWRIKCQPMRHTRAAVMGCDLKARKTKPRHQRDHIGGHFPLGIGRVIGADRGLG